MPEHLRAGILLGAFAGLRVAEACGLRVTDVDFLRGVITPAVQYPAEPLKTETSRTPVPIPRTLSTELAAHVGRWHGEHVLTGEAGESGWQLGPWVLERAVRAARERVEGLPDGFRYHDLRHYLASLLIAVRGVGEGRAGPTPARLGDHHAGHLQPPVARLRRVDQDRRGSGPGRPCGLSADSGGDHLT